MYQSSSPAPARQWQLTQAFFTLVGIVVFCGLAPEWMHRYTSLPLGALALSPLLHGGRLP